LLALRQIFLFQLLSYKGNKFLSKFVEMLLWFNFCMLTFFFWGMFKLFTWIISCFHFNSTFVFFNSLLIPVFTC
jgi:hypothetical protein